MKRILALALFALTAAAQDNTLTRLLRQPDIHGNQVVFVYAGDRGAQAVGVARLVMAAGPIAPTMPPGMFETATAQRWLNVSRPALPW